MPNTHLDLSYLPVRGAHVLQGSDCACVAITFDIGDGHNILADVLATVQDWAGYDSHDICDGILAVYCRTVQDVGILDPYNNRLDPACVPALHYAVWSDAGYGLRLVTHADQSLDLLVRMLSWSGAAMVTAQATISAVGSMYDADHSADD